MKKRSFVNEYFEGKSGERLRKTISPNWNSTEGHLKVINIPHDIDSVLEVGCGVGRLLKELNVFIPNCVGFDASVDMVRESAEYCKDTNIKILKCDGNGLIPYQNAEFDCCFSIITFQHIPNTDTVKLYISEMYRLLKPNGIIKFQILKNDEFPEKDLWAYHDPKILMDYMNQLNFKNIEINDSGGRWSVIEAVK